MQYTHKQGVAALVNFFVGVAELLLLLRVVLRFFNGNPDATFVHWAYSNTSVLLEPLRGVFPSSVGVVQRGWVVDFTALFAMAAYAAAGYLLLSLAANWAMRRK